MGFSRKPKYAKIDPKNPRALGVCDDSDFVFNREDLVPQMEWRGDQLVPTGFLRGRPFVDEPQPQLRPPRLLADPYPVKNPRLPQPSSNGYQEVTVPPPDVLLAILQQQTFTIPGANPNTNPNAPQGAPDGIPVPSYEIIMATLRNVSFTG